MREIVVLSGKGGAGKTSLTAAFAALAARDADTVVCDLDVDAPDLHILLDPVDTVRETFVSGHVAAVDPAACDGCGLCKDLCRFGAVREVAGGCVVDPRRCEGCKLCVALCTRRAIEFLPRTCGFWAVADTRFGPMVHARLDPGA